ncbi:MAG: response regulator, partial [Devosia sp.]
MAIDILIAEDEPSILESLDFILRRAGYTIGAVTDGDAVLEAVGRLTPRLLVLDVMLPKRSGFDVL